MNSIDFKALIHIQACKPRLKAEQYEELRQQVLAGDPDGAMKNLRKILLIEGSNAIKTYAD